MFPYGYRGYNHWFVRPVVPAGVVHPFYLGWVGFMPAWAPLWEGIDVCYYTIFMRYQSCIGDVQLDRGRREKMLREMIMEENHTTSTTEVTRVVRQLLDNEERMDADQYGRINLDQERIERDRYDDRRRKKEDERREDERDEWRRRLDREDREYEERRRQREERRYDERRIENATERVREATITQQIVPQEQRELVARQSAEALKNGDTQLSLADAAKKMADIREGRQDDIVKAAVLKNMSGKAKLVGRVPAPAPAPAPLPILAPQPRQAIFPPPPPPHQSYRPPHSQPQYSQPPVTPRSHRTPPPRPQQYSQTPPRQQQNIQNPASFGQVITSNHITTTTTISSSSTVISPGGYQQQASSGTQYQYTADTSAPVQQRLPPLQAQPQPAAYRHPTQITQGLQTPSTVAMFNQPQPRQLRVPVMIPASSSRQQSAQQPAQPSYPPSRYQEAPQSVGGLIKKPTRLTAPSHLPPSSSKKPANDQQALSKRVQDSGRPPPPSTRPNDQNAMAKQGRDSTNPQASPPPGRPTDHNAMVKLLQGSSRPVTPSTRPNDQNAMFKTAKDSMGKGRPPVPSKK